MQSKGQPEVAVQCDEEEKPKKKKKKLRSVSPDVEPEEPSRESVEQCDVVEKLKKKKKKKLQDESTVPEAEQLSTEPCDDDKKLKKKKKKLRDIPPTPEPEEPSTKSIEQCDDDEKPKRKKKLESPPAEKPSKKSFEPDVMRGANAVYSTNIIQIPSHVAEKLTSMSIDNFKNANIANVVGYGLTEDIEMKTVQTKIGDNSNNTDKYSLYNMDRLTTKNKVNQRKIISKLKRTKKSIQVIWDGCKVAKSYQIKH